MEEMGVDRWNSHAMTLPYFPKICNCMWYEITGSGEKEVVRDDKDGRIFMWLVRDIQVFQDTKITNLKSIALLDYLFHMVLLKYSTMVRQWLVKMGILVWGFCEWRERRNVVRLVYGVGVQGACVMHYRVMMYIQCPPHECDCCSMLG